MSSNSNSHRPHEVKSVVSRSGLWSLRHFSVRQYGLILVGLLILAGGILLFASGGHVSQVYSGKLIGFDDPRGLTYMPDLTGSNATAWRHETDINGNSFDTSANMDNIVNTTSKNHIVYLPIFNSYDDPTTTTTYSNHSNWATGVANWCKKYCAGGTFWVNNTTGNETYAPRTLEMMNEPYGNWYRPNASNGHQVPATDYAGIVQAVRQAVEGLSSSGINNITILASASDVNKIQWANDVSAAGGYTGSDVALAVHPYGIALPTDDPGPSQGWPMVNYFHKLFSKDVYVTEQGWCTSGSCGDAGGPINDPTRAFDIQAALDEVASNSWLKGYIYFGLYQGNSTYGLIPNGPTNQGNTPTYSYDKFRDELANIKTNYADEFGFSPLSGPPPADTTPPVIGAPGLSLAGNEVSGSVQVSIDAHDDMSGISAVQFKLNGANLGGVAASNGAGLYYTSWDTTRFADGTYSLTATATDGAGNVATSPALTAIVKNSDSQIPTQPTGLTAKASSSAEVDLTWNAAPNNIKVASYKVHRYDTNKGPVDFTIPAPTSGSTVSYKDTAVSAGTYYTYSVSAVNAAGNESIDSATVSITTPGSQDKIAPSVPAGLKTTGVTATSVSLSWNASADTGGSGLAGYHVYRSGRMVGSPTGTSFTDTGLSPAVVYSYSVSAYDNAANGSAASSPITVTTLTPSDTQAPSVPTNVHASAVSSAEVDLGWTASTDNVGVVAYKIYRNGSSTALASVAPPSGTAVTYKDTAVSANTQYSYTVLAVDGAGNASAKSSPPASVTTPANPDKTPPSVPAGLKSSNITTNAATISWGASTDTGGSGLAGYHLYRNNVLIASPAGTSYADTGLSPSTTYTYSVSAYDNAANGSVASSPLSVTTSPVTSSNTVSNFKWHADTKTLTWDAFQGAGAYTIATTFNPGTKSAYTAYTYPRIAGTGYKPPTLNGQTVNYSISPVNGGATGSGTALAGYSPVITVAWPSGPTLVQNLQWNSNTQTLTWDAFPGAGAYTVAAVYNPGTNSQYTTYTYPRITGTSYQPPSAYGKTVDYSVSPVKGGATGSGTALASYSKYVQVVWPAKPWWQVW